MSQQSVIEFHIGNNIPTDKDEIRVDDVEVVDCSESIPRAHTFGRYDCFDNEIGESRPSRFTAQNWGGNQIRCVSALLRTSGTVVSD